MFSRREPPSAAIASRRRPYPVIPVGQSLHHELALLLPMHAPLAAGLGLSTGYVHRRETSRRRVKETTAGVQGLPREVDSLLRRAVGAGAVQRQREVLRGGSTQCSDGATRMLAAAR